MPTCVEWRDEKTGKRFACLLKRGHKLDPNAWSDATQCGHFVIGRIGDYRGEPTCPDCLGTAKGKPMTELEQIKQRPSEFTRGPMPRSNQPGRRRRGPLSVITRRRELGLTEAHWRALKAIAARLGCSWLDVIRQLIEREAGELGIARPRSAETQLVWASKLPCSSCGNPETVLGGADERGAWAACARHARAQRESRS